MTAPSPARPARRVLRTLLTAVLAGAIAVGPAGVASATTTPTPTPTTAPGTVTLTLSPVAGGVAASGTGVTAVAAVQNDTASIVPATSLRLLLGETPLATRGEATAWADAPDARTLLEVGSVTLDAVPAGGRRTWSFVVSPADPVLSTRAPGVYPLLVVYGDGTTARTSSSTLVVPSTVTAATPVGIVVPITAPPRTTGLIPPDELAAMTAADGTLTQQLDGVDGTGAILAIDPAVLASIRVLGAGAPETASSWLARVLALPNSRFALQFGDADVAAQLHSEIGMLLQPPPFDAQLDAADFAVEQPAGSATATPGAITEPELPTLDELLDVGAADTAPLYWPATGTADAAVVDRLSEGDDSSLTLVDSETASGSAVTVDARAEGVLVYDTALSAALRDVAGLDDGVLRGAALARVTAQLAFALPQAAGDPLLVAVDRGGDARSRVALRAAIAAVSGADGVVLDDLDDLVAAPASPLTIAGGATDPARSAAVDALVADETAVQSFASILDDPRLLTSPQRASALQVLGLGWVDDDAAWQSALASQRAATAGTLGAVSIPPPTDVNLLTANTRLQFVVRNALPWPVTVTLVAEPDDPRLRVQRLTTVSAGPTSDTRVVVPVESRVGSGDVTVGLQLRSPTGVDIGPADAVDVRVRAEWEGFGVVALAVIVGGLLVLGVIRTVRRRRASRHPADDDPGAGTPAGEPVA